MSDKGETASHLCIELTEQQRQGLYDLFVGYRGMQQRTMSVLIDCLLARSAEGKERLLGAILTKEVRFVLDREIAPVPFIIDKQRLEADLEFRRLYGKAQDEPNNTKDQPTKSIPVNGIGGSPSYSQEPPHKAGEGSE